MTMAPDERSGRAPLEADRVTSAAVAVAIVTFESAAELPGCLAAVGALDHRPLELVVVDCGSRDHSAELARERAPREIPTRVVALGENRGFAGGMNAALASSDAPFVLSLNPDARPRPDFVSRLLARQTAHPELAVGAVAGRLLRPGAPGEPARLDACGMRLTLTWRHLDRGSGRRAEGRYLHPERVFGATGAASLWARAALDDVAVDGEIFDPRFHSYREDAELCFRLRERGWEVLYEPLAVAEHRRVNLPTRRRAMSAEVNYHSLKNRFLLRLYHQRAANELWTLGPTLLRDALALAYVGMWERTSWRAFPWLWRQRHDLWARRRAIQVRRTVSAWQVDRWFWRRSLPL